MRRYTTLWNLKCSKIDIISTLPNTGCSLSVVSYKQDYWFLQTSEAIWRYVLRYHGVVCDRLFWLRSFLHDVFTQRVYASFAASTPKMHRGHPYELPNLWPPNSPDLNTIDCKIWGRGMIWQRVYRTIVLDVNDWRTVVKVVMWSRGGGSPDEARLEQTLYPFHTQTQLIWRYLGIK